MVNFMSRNVEINADRKLLAQSASLGQSVTKRPLLTNGTKKIKTALKSNSNNEKC